MNDDSKEKKTLSLKTPVKVGRAGDVKKKIFQRDDSGHLRVVSPGALQQQRQEGRQNLTDQERASRVKILARAAQSNDFGKTDKEFIKGLEAKEQSRKLEESQKEVELKKSQEERRRIAEEDRKRREAEARRKFEQTAKQAGISDEVAVEPSTMTSVAGSMQRPGGVPAKKGRGGRDSNRFQKRRGNSFNKAKLILGDADSERQRSEASVRRARQKDRMKAMAQDTQEKVYREVILPETIMVGDLANRMSERLQDVIKKLMQMGIMATQQMIIDADTAELIIHELGHSVKRVAESDVENILKDEPAEDVALLKPRPPVVTVMGHVDHGKTSLLDALRATDVAAGEAGGITQHIGAALIHLKNGKAITFLDTPGHEAFTALRARGAIVTDIVVLVVAADDGIQAQTIEAIHHAKAANVPMVVAINKCDKPGADPDRVRQELLREQIVVEQLGGEVQSVEVSAKSKLNLEKLEEAILLQAEILDLKANPNTLARGVVIESKIEQGRGPVATVIVKKGTLNVGDIFVMGSSIGKVRALLDDHGKPIKHATPGTPAEVLGLQALSEAGHDLVVLENESKAREIADYRLRKKKESDMAKMRRGTMEQMFANIKSGAQKNLPLIVKTDVQGSLEALLAAFDKMGTAEVKAQVLHAAVGPITESDVALASSSGGIIIGFNVRAGANARQNAKRDSVDIRYYSIIYQAIDDLKNLLSGLLAPEEREDYLGVLDIREVFKITGSGMIAGCMVEEGQVKRGASVRLLRDNVVIYEGKLRQLKRFKEDVREVGVGYECGVQLERFEDIKVGDKVECFEIKTIARSL
ncbi:MAG: translation initiation factor IF-2 [Hydrotalea sp.]|nr:translation initiation factor IF-2 [Hydrotalea sp.]